MCVPAARQFRGLASWPGSCASLDALPGEVPVGGRVDKPFISGNTRQYFDETALWRAQSDIAKLRNALAVENIHAIERAASDYSGARNEDRLPCTIGELGRSIHTGARLA